ncbi:enoyl-CoA hydratase/isomerase family protein [Solirubrobacter sp. CPCC 204708]|uniref:Enoyl-CoA hydratase-related protein n=1 Tax=Solirubrobacter deserti TaxID=2282478 RepID=A0ABT4RPV8_9ACTN|nr:enoyl-CoA hydratase-related protein [Solirubrobacter deserti]MBE2318264.1 enoyl-CoA hydratase/isomerase family protein [Solirubrobacter deserti]MDA0140602.1 enoyl-CoA hydratase-related protein [Solirubrobacter deserti]
MFVFKAAVVGTGELGEEIAGAIRAAGVEVVHTDGFDGLGDVDFAIEATGGDLDAAHEVFAALDAATPGHSVLATATSSLSITEIGEITLRPDKVVGFHWIAGTRLVEVVEGDDTSAETVQCALTFAQALRKSAVRCADAPGFIVQRVTAADDPLVEACLVLEDGVAGLREIDLALALGAGMKPGPFAAADREGLGAVLARVGDPPVTLRRLVASGRTGVQAGQGFYPYPQPEPGYEDAAVKLDLRGRVAVVWLQNPPANSLSPAVIAGLRRAWEELQGRARAMVLASANPALFCAGADIKAFTEWDAESGRAHLEDIHALAREWERSPIVTIAAINGLAFGGGCEIAMACDLRLAAGSASFGQPEINLGIIPGFGGTQRLPRLVGAAKALEMNLLGEPISATEAYECGLVNRVVDDQDLFDAALAYGRKAAGQAPIALEQIKRVSGQADLDEGLAVEVAGFLDAFTSEDGEEGIRAFIEKRAPEFKGR